MKITKRQLRRIIREEYRRILSEGNTDVFEGDHDPITVEIPVLQSLADTENFDGEKVWFSSTKAVAIAELLEDGEPNEEDYFDPQTYEIDSEYKDKKEEYDTLCSLIPELSSEEREELAQNIRDAISSAEEDGYSY